jgi:hypothetical protein
MTTPTGETQAAQQFFECIFAKLRDEQGVHAETAVSAAARMAGTFLLRDCGLPIERLEPGAPVLSDAVNAQGPLLVEILGLALQGLQVPIDPARAAAAAERAAKPRLTVLQMQALLEPGMTGIKDAHRLTYGVAARSAALATASFVKACASVLEPDAAFGIATYGFVEGAKTVPQRLAGARPAGKPPWYKWW